MAAIVDLSEYINRGTGGNSGAPQYLTKFYSARTNGAVPANPIAGRPMSLWTYDSTRGGRGVAPGAVAAPTNATNGSMLHTDASGGRDLWLTYLGGSALIGGRVLLEDRLLHIGGLSGTTTTAQTVGGTLTRNTGGEGNQIWVEIYTAVGGTATTITASYTNQAGTSGRTTVATTFGGTNFNTSTRIIALPLQAGDTGVQAVASVTVLATTGTAGNFGVTVVKPVISCSFMALGSGGEIGALAKGLPPVKVDPGACLFPIFVPTAATVPELQLDLIMFER